MIPGITITKHLEMVFSFAGKVSIEKERKSIAISAIQIEITLSKGIFLDIRST